MATKFEKIKISDETYESCSVFDVDGDGVLDIVSGAYWYKGPDFKQKFKICDIAPEDEYFDAFSDYPMDVNGDGKLDIISGGWWGKALKWFENPGDTGEWKVHIIDECNSIETTRFYDIDGDGVVEIFPNIPFEPQCFYKLENGKFVKYVIGTERADHGMGIGDIDGDGKMEIILNNGYLKQVGSVFDKWEFVKTFDFPMASVPILVHDVNGDGINDIIIGAGHGYGLYWYEQKADGTFVQHLIDDKHAQFHDMQLLDIDNDGQVELVTGKRFRAHCGRDPGDNDNPWVVYYKINGGKFELNVIDEGDPSVTAGTGIYFWAADLNGNGKLDLVCPGKTGLYLFRNV